MLECVYCGCRYDDIGLATLCCVAVDEIKSVRGCLYRCNCGIIYGTWSDVTECDCHEPIFIDDEEPQV